MHSNKNTMVEDTDDILHEMHEDYINQTSESGIPLYLLKEAEEQEPEDVIPLPWRCVKDADREITDEKDPLPF